MIHLNALQWSTTVVGAWNKYSKIFFWSSSKYLQLKNTQHQINLFWGCLAKHNLFSFNLCWYQKIYCTMQSCKDTLKLALQHRSYFIYPQPLSIIFILSWLTSERKAATASSGLSCEEVCSCCLSDCLQSPTQAPCCHISSLHMCYPPSSSIFLKEKAT